MSMKNSNDIESDIPKVNPPNLRVKFQFPENVVISNTGV